MAPGGFIDWLVEAWAWLRHAATPSALARRHIVTPTPVDFPIDPQLEGEDLAEDYFLFVREHAGLMDWPLWVLPEGEDAQPQEGFPIPYDPSLLDNPCALVWRFARGSAYYVVQTAAPPPPMDEDERLVDATAIYLGFGLFPTTVMLRSHRRGPFVVCESCPALSESELLTALALYGILGEIPDRTIEAHLTPRARSVYRAAVKGLLRHHAWGLARLRGLMPPPRGPYR